MDSRDSTKERPVSEEKAPKDRRVPLAVVEFNQPTAIPGSSILYTRVTPGEVRTASGSQYTCPAAFWDPETDKIWIEGRLFPMERVHYFERAKMAKTVTPGKLPDYTIGKRQ